MQNIFMRSPTDPEVIERRLLEHYGPKHCVVIDEFGRKVYMFNTKRSLLHAIRVLRCELKVVTHVKNAMDFIESLPSIGPMKVYYPD